MRTGPEILILFMQENAMKVSRKVQQIYKYIPIILFFAYALWIHRDVVLYSDDVFYQPSLKNSSIFSWCRDFYRLWGGRVPLQLLDIIFLNLPLIVWKVCNSIVYTLVPFYISRISQLFREDMDERRVFFLNLCICILLIFLPESVMRNSVIWITGSFNYLLPSSMLLIGIYPFLAVAIGRKASGIDIVVAWPGVFLAAYAEQTAAVFLCMAGFCCAYVFYRKKRILRTYILLFAFGIVNALIQYLAPGNAVRYEAEVLKWYPEFDMYNLFDKALLGLVHFLKAVFVPGYVFFWAILMLMGIVILKKGRLYQCCYLGLCVMTIVVKNISDYFTDEAIWQIYSKRVLFEIFLVLIWILVFAWLIFCFIKEQGGSVVAALFFLAAVASGMVMGMSPTVYVSGDRVFLLCYILLILLAALIFCEVEPWSNIDIDNMHKI